MQTAWSLLGIILIKFTRVSQPYFVGLMAAECDDKAAIDKGIKFLMSKQVLFF